MSKKTGKSLVRKQLKKQMSLLIEENTRLAMGQVNGFVEQAFSENKDGLYTSKMLKLGLTRQVIVPPDEPNGSITMDSSKAVIEVPVISLVPINFLGIKKCKLKVKGRKKKSTIEADIEMGQIPIPAGLNLLLNAFTDSISPTNTAEDPREGE